MRPSGLMLSEVADKVHVSLAIVILLSTSITLACYLQSDKWVVCVNPLATLTEISTFLLATI